MDSQLLRQKRQKKITRAIRLYYGCFVSLLITVSAALNLQNFHPLILLLLLPLNLYFFPAAYWQTINYRRFAEKCAGELDISLFLKPSTAFSLANFLLQPSFAFRVSLILFLLAMAGSFNNQPVTILSPLP